MTKLTLEIQYPIDGNLRGSLMEYTVKQGAWDLDVAEMCEMFTGLLRNAGFHIGDLVEEEE